MIAPLIPPVVLAALLALTGWLMGLMRRWWPPRVLRMTGAALLSYRCPSLNFGV